MTNKPIKLKSIYLVLIVLAPLLSSCYFRHSSEPEPINLKKDREELALAKKSLRYIAEGKIDSLELIISKEAIESSQPEHLQWLYKTGKKVINTSQYPKNSKIKVTYISRIGRYGYDIVKLFDFPFYNPKEPNSTMVFQIAVARDEINTLFLSYPNWNRPSVNRNYEHGSTNSGYINDSTRVIRNFHSNGQMESRSVYVHGKLYGKYQAWYKNGKLKSEIQYKNGVRDGLTINWYSNGKKQEELLYKNNGFVKYLNRWDQEGNKLSLEDE
ncbi:toxin-antitoxin system YwqK family antitoxin [Plebeiibacterium sediminum]|uniref:Toxin-antitoxin system YwqK family antitoxin n=1 Tax=Plebeiibacterium sediminum TaxID=2992112 RepID=A0AAE3SH39_9BACT|nr:hypothetical protein [Plebeiobacterium sediminum]MCW3789165.1 hypothetical protein [Plebeiobacterium sediminum]